MAPPIIIVAPDTQSIEARLDEYQTSLDLQKRVSENPAALIEGLGAVEALLIVHLIRYIGTFNKQGGSNFSQGGPPFYWP